MANPVKLTDQALSLIRSLSFTEENTAEAAQKQAREWLSQAEALNPDCPNYIQIGLAYMEMGEAELSLQALNKALELNPHNQAAILFLAVRAGDIGQYDLCEKHLQQLRELSPENQALPSAEAWLMIMRGRYDEALKILLPDKGRFDLTVSPPILSRLCLAVEKYLLPLEMPQFLEENTETLDAELAPLAESETTVPTNHTEPPADAAATAADESEQTPPVSEAATEESNAAKVLTEAENSLAKLPKAASLNLEPVKGSAYLLSKRGYERLEQCLELKAAERPEMVTKAVQELQSAYQNNPQDAEILYGLGVGLLCMCEYCHCDTHSFTPQLAAELVRSEELLTASLKANQRNCYAWHSLGCTCFWLKKYAKAQECWHKAIAMFEKLPESHYCLGQLCAVRSQDAQARMWFTRALLSDMQQLHIRLQDMGRHRQIANSASPSSPA